MIKALSISSDSSGCDYHRLTLPFRYAGAYVDNAAFEPAKGNIDELLNIADLVVFNRQIPLNGLDIQTIKQKGAKVILDLDDYWELNPSHYLYNAYKLNKTAEKICRNIRLSDAVTVTTTRLAEKVSQYNKNVHVIPNALPFGSGQFCHNGGLPGAKVGVLYTGQVSHLNDLGLLSEAMARFADEGRPDIHFNLAGFVATNTICLQMEAIFTAGGRLKNYERIAHKGLDEYMSVYDSADIVMVPLLNNSFNRHKSNLKLLEAGAKKLPVICSKVAPYSDEEAPVLWAESKSDWYKHVTYLADNRNFARDLGERLHEWACSKYNIEYWNKYRFELYQNIVNS